MSAKNKWQPLFIRIINLCFNKQVLLTGTNKAQHNEAWNKEAWHNEAWHNETWHDEAWHNEPAQLSAWLNCNAMA